jgi:hypothetical protein
MFIRSSKKIQGFFSPRKNLSNHFTTSSKVKNKTIGRMNYSDSNIRNHDDIFPEKIIFPEGRRNRSEPVIFSGKQFIVAAAWWAQFLPGMSKTGFDDINCYSEIEGTYKDIMGRLHKIHQSSAESVTEEQSRAFISILFDKMTKLELDSGHYNHQYYLQIGNGSSYDTPKIIDEVLVQANINVFSMGAFPFKTVMRIHNNGHIQVGDTVIPTNPEVVHYDHSNTYFDHAAWMKFTANKFRLLEIDLDNLKDNLLEGYKGNLSHLQRPNISFDAIGSDTKYAYTSIKLGDFKGSEKEFLQFSSNDLIAILQNEDSLYRYFEDSIFLFYEKSKKYFMKNSYGGKLGKVAAEQVGENYYQYSTGPVKVLSAPHAGTVGAWFTPVSPNDFIVRNEKNQWDDPMGGLSSDDVCEARLCDDKGNLFSEKIYKPGDELPCDKFKFHSFGLFTTLPKNVLDIGEQHSESKLKL